MTSGAAVLTTDCGGIRDYVKDGENAIVLARDDISAIPKKIEMLMHDAELRSRLSENALEAAKLFSWESTIDQIEEYYREIARYEVDANAAL